MSKPIHDLLDRSVYRMSDQQVRAAARAYLSKRAGFASRNTKGRTHLGRCSNIPNQSHWSFVQWCGSSGL